MFEQKESPLLTTTPPAVCADSQRSEISLLGKLVSMETRGSGEMMLLVEQQPWINHVFQHTQNVISPPEVCVYGGIFSSCTVWNLALIQLEIKCKKIKTEERTEFPSAPGNGSGSHTHLLKNRKKPLQIKHHKLWRFAKLKESDGENWLCETWALTWRSWAFKEGSRWCLRGMWVNQGADVLFCWGVAER